MTQTSLSFALMTGCLLTLVGCGNHGDDATGANNGGAGAGSAGQGTSAGAGGSAAGAGGSVAGSGGNIQTVPTNRRCQNDSDCVVAYDTGDACYSRGCTAPIGVRADALASGACLVAWPTDDPEPVTACAHNDGTAPCAALCVHPYPCYAASCASGQCTVKGDVISGVCR